jgi:hypothetical protein
VRFAQNDISPDTDRLYAWLSRDADGIEGIITVSTDEAVFIPLVFTDRSQALFAEGYARASAQVRQFPAELVVFARGETIRRIEGSPNG